MRIVKVLYEHPWFRVRITVWNPVRRRYSWLSIDLLPRDAYELYVALDHALRAYNDHISNELTFCKHFPLPRWDDEAVL